MEKVLFRSDPSKIFEFLHTLDVLFEVVSERYEILVGYEEFLSNFFISLTTETYPGRQNYDISLNRTGKCNQWTIESHDLGPHFRF